MNSLNSFISSILVSKGLSSKHSDNLAKLISNTYFPTKDREHNQFAGYISHSYKYIQSIIGRRFGGKLYSKDCLDALNDKVNVFDVISDHMKGSYTKGYKCQTWLSDLITDYLEQRYIKVNLNESSKTCASRRLAISTLDSNGARRKTTSNIKRAIRIDREALKALYAKPVVKRGDVNDLNRLKRIKKQALNLLLLSNGSDLPVGWIASIYQEKPSGRLYGSGCHMQNVCIEVRQAALNGMYELDMTNAHYTFLYESCLKHGVELTRVKNYLDNKADIRQRLSDKLSMDVKDVKQLLISIIYGATIKVKFIGGNQTAIRQLFNDDRAWYKCVTDNFVKKLANDVKRGSEIIISNASKYGEHIYNVLGKPINNKTPKSKVSSHLLQGIEAKALDSVVNNSNNIAVLLHDGIVFYDKPSKEYYQSVIMNSIGFDIGLDESSITC